MACLSVFPWDHDSATMVHSWAQLKVSLSMIFMFLFFRFVGRRLLFARRTRDFRHVRFIDVFPGCARSGSPRGSRPETLLRLRPANVMDRHGAIRKFRTDLDGESRNQNRLINAATPFEPIRREIYYRLQRYRLHSTETDTQDDQS